VSLRFILPSPRALEHHSPALRVWKLKAARCRLKASRPARTGSRPQHRAHSGTRHLVIPSAAVIHGLRMKQIPFLDRKVSAVIPKSCRSWVGQGAVLVFPTPGRLFAVWPRGGSGRSVAIHCGPRARARGTIPDSCGMSKSWFARRPSKQVGTRSPEESVARQASRHAFARGAHGLRPLA